MSSFVFRAKNKLSGEIHSVWAIDDYFGKHEYGFIINEADGKTYREKEFEEIYERIEDI